MLTDEKLCGLVGRWRSGSPVVVWGLLGPLGSRLLRHSGIVQCLAPFLMVQGLIYNMAG